MGCDRLLKLKALADRTLTNEISSTNVGEVQGPANGRVAPWAATRAHRGRMRVEGGRAWNGRGQVNYILADTRRQQKHNLRANGMEAVRQSQPPFHLP